MTSKKTPRCLICKKDATEYFPFCSKRCRLIDLAGWLNERYTIPDDDHLEENSHSTQHHHDLL